MPRLCDEITSDTRTYVSAANAMRGAEKYSINLALSYILIHTEDPDRPYAVCFVLRQSQKHLAALLASKGFFVVG